MIELPKDAEGREIPLDTEVLYDSCGTKVSVKEFLFEMSVGNQRTEWTIKAAYEGNLYYNSFKPKNMHITQPDVQVPLCYLAKSLENMSKCHVAYFCKGWENARGCRIEHDAAVAYGLEVLYED